jgi:hypothetical protein
MRFTTLFYCQYILYICITYETKHGREKDKIASFDNPFFGRTRFL